VTATLQEQVAVITGAGQGVGQGIAFSLAKRGAKVVAVGRTLSKCEDTVIQIKERFGTDAIALEADIGQIDALENVVNQAVKTFGRLDILVNNAVSAQISSLMDASIEKFEEGLRVGPIATLRLMQLAQPHMVKSGGGSIINLASSAARRWDSSNYGVYAAEKEAIRALSRAAANEWGPLGIRTNTILPLAQSPALAAWATYRPEEAAAFVKTVPMQRVGDCEQDIGEFVAVLCSPESGYVNGQSIAIDGGQVNLD
jgi:NAD(P)-dependent dehydrogenase (short-subunit alcohol dehydrogenase family)